MKTERNEIVDHLGIIPDDPDYYPPCDISGKCEPHELDLDESEAMCQYCGGWRYKDYPYFGNWGVK